LLTRLCRCGAALSSFKTLSLTFASQPTVNGFASESNAHRDQGKMMRIDGQTMDATGAFAAAGRAVTVARASGLSTLLFGALLIGGLLLLIGP
jgi:hypothetical protein